MAEKRSEISEMSDVGFAQEVMRGYVDSRPGTGLKQKIASAAAALKWNYSRVKAVRYGEARTIKAAEMDQLCRAAKIERRMREIASEHDELTERLARVEGLLATLVARLDGSAPHSPL